MQEVSLLVNVADNFTLIKLLPVYAYFNITSNLSHCCTCCCANEKLLNRMNKMLSNKPLLNFLFILLGLSCNYFKSLNNAEFLLQAYITFCYSNSFSRFMSFFLFGLSGKVKTCQYDIGRSLLFFLNNSWRLPESNR